MHYSQAAALLILPFVVMINGSQYIQSRIVASGGCESYTCGVNARCTMSEGRPVCSCYNLHMGDPLARCVRVECLINDDCPYNRVCTNNRCVDPCVGLCGVNANCVTRNHIGTCQCLPGHDGDPFSGCQVSDPQAACKPSPCGENTQCEVINQVPVCTCLHGYRGSPLAGCRHECETDSECPQHLACSSSFRCESPCKCGDNAECEVVNHQAKCTCPKTWVGNPYVSCRPECTAHSECPPSKPACLYQKCVNPCDGVCGVNADCNLRGITPVCSCPRHMTGNPFVSCRLFEPRDLCEPNPCGSNAICTPGHDNTGRERPVCTCPNGYIGNALTSCQRGECFTDSDCSDNRACIDYTCSNPCTGRECGPSATCTPRHHIAVCTCPQGTRGDALYTCNPIESKSVYNYGRAYRYRY
ncbi:neurogenic locus notch homolog protein 3 [Nylanderia fulva]|uniref:neurogenic locus notch homolog protein 3 n=1 Tax=Nylanderia fulva TaxID=613905 RepID=UPI0010FBB8F3|nr:neurogenic locus notch homolog protein 3 [Nylanderia fulva]